MMNGDNIYHRGPDGCWLQADSHHSRPDGRPEPQNVERDTSTDRVLLSRQFLYFGSRAPLVPEHMLAAVSWTNGLGHRVYDDGECDALIAWLWAAGAPNELAGEPFQFRQGAMRYSGRGGRIIS